LAGDQEEHERDAAHDRAGDRASLAQPAGDEAEHGRRIAQYTGDLAGISFHFACWSSPSLAGPSVFFLPVKLLYLPRVGPKTRSRAASPSTVPAHGPSFWPGQRSPSSRP